MGAKGLIMTTCIGVLSIAVVATVYVLTGVEWGTRGNEGLPLMLFLMAGVCLLGFLIYRTKSSLAKWGARLAVSSEEGKTVDDGLDLFKRYSPFLLAAAAVLIVGGMVGLLRY